jgi:methylated-DNA-protein-cysteine methyltransferase-like protein
MNKSDQTLYQNIYNIISKIPQGKVATYKQVAESAGIAGHARVIGYALHKLPEGSNVPWHRVINSKGKISYSISRNGHDDLQKILLINEGVQFSVSDVIDLNKFGYL